MLAGESLFRAAWRRPPPPVEDPITGVWPALPLLFAAAAAPVAAVDALPASAPLPAAAAAAVAAAVAATFALKARLLLAAILRSLPRPLMPLFEFLYREPKYSHNSLSAGLMGSPSRMLANFCVSRLSDCAWNLF